MSDWFRRAEDRPAAAPLVFCFAHAGGDPGTFLRWQTAIGDHAALVAVKPPGRGTPAIGIEPWCDRMAGAIREEAAGTPFVLFGHSMGAMLAFEIGRRLGDTPAHLVASGCNAPVLLPTARVIATARLDGPAFAEAVRFFGGLPDEVLSDPDLCALLLSDVRADFRLVADYTYRPGPRLPFGVSLVNGHDDPHVSPAGLTRWADECVTEPTSHWVDGDHFYFQQRPEAITDILVTVAGAVAPHTELI